MLALKYSQPICFWYHITSTISRSRGIPIIIIFSPTRDFNRNSSVLVNMPLNHAMESREYFKTYRLFISIWSASLALAVDHRTRALWVSSPQSRHMASLPPLTQMIQEPLPPSSSPPCNTHPQLHCQWGFWQHGNVSCFWAFLAHAVSVMFSFTCHRHQPCSRLCNWCETLYNGDTLRHCMASTWASAFCSGQELNFWGS